MEVTVTEIVRDEGSIVLFSGLTDDGGAVVFACDHRPAQALINGMLNDEEVVAFVDDWQIVGRREPDWANR